ncbi:MAG: hypothetical protein ACI8TP_004500 [Acidimicrobiales bacterium]
MTVLLLSSPIVVIALAIFGFALYETTAARRERQSLLRVAPEAASQHAAAGVVRARARFSTAVEAYEMAMANAPDLVSVAESTGPSLFRPAAETPFAGSSLGIEQLEANKEIARTELLDAQRLWESVRPSVAPDAAISLWTGYGVLRGWQLGPIGFERAFVRCEHILDPTCWAAFELKRMRWGFALGAESQRLALFAAAVPTERVAEILSQGLGGAEAALRPGFAPTRWWRRRGRLPAPRRASGALLQTFDLADGLDEPTRAVVRKAFEVEMGDTPENIRSLGDLDGVLSILAGGPSALVGVWAGPQPQARLLAGSAHTSWGRAA